MRTAMLVAAAAAVVAASIVVVTRGAAAASGGLRRSGGRSGAAAQHTSPRTTAHGINALFYEGRERASKNAAAGGGGAASRHAASGDAGGPRRSRRTTDVPLVMKRIYDAMSEANDQGADEVRDDLDGFDIVRGLEDQSGGVEKLRYRFDPSSVDLSREAITKVEFYVFTKKQSQRVGGAPLFPSAKTSIKLSLFRVLDDQRLFGQNGTIDTSSGASLLVTRRILATHQDDVDFSGSRALRDAVEQWLAQPETNKGLLMVVTDLDDAPLDGASALFVDSGDRSSPGKQPVLAVYTKSRSNTVDAAQTQRHRRHAGQPAPADAAQAPACSPGPADAAGSSHCPGRASGGHHRAPDRTARMRAVAAAAEVRRRRPSKRIVEARFGAGGETSRSSSASSSEEDSGFDSSYGSGGGESPPSAAPGMPHPAYSAAALGADAGSAPPPPPPWQASACRAQPFIVNFDELNMPVIAPAKMNIKRCSGTCVLPPTYLERQNMTNHAKLMATVRYLNPTRGLAGPCCVPNELSKASVLYSDEDGIVTMRNYDSMVIVSCACR